MSKWCMEPVCLSSMYADLQIFLTHAGSCLSCSQVWQRFFTEETKSTSEFPIRVEEGRGKLTDNLCGFTSIDSILLSFHWSLLCVIHSLTSVIQFYMVSIVVWIWSGTVSLHKRLSSANAWCWIECFLISSNRGCVYKTKRTGPKTEPWGTSKLRGASSDLRPLTVTIWVMSEGYDLNQDKDESLRPKVCSSRWRRMLWSMVSNAANRSSSVKKQILLLSRTVRRSFTILRSAVSVLWWGLYADRRRLKSLLKIRWSFSWERTILSVILDKNGRVDTGS